MHHHCGKPEPAISALSPKRQGKNGSIPATMSQGRMLLPGHSQCHSLKWLNPLHGESAAIEGWHWPHLLFHCSTQQHSYAGTSPGPQPRSRSSCSQQLGATKAGLQPLSALRWAEQQHVGFWGLRGLHWLSCWWQPTDSAPSSVRLSATALFTLALLQLSTFSHYGFFCMEFWMYCFHNNLFNYWKLRSFKWMFTACNLQTQDLSVLQYIPQSIWTSMFTT